jgi:O-antigen/teichoic acid export membrane protein
MRLGGWMTVSNVAGPLLQYSDRFAVGSFVSTAAISYYFIAYEASQRVMLATTSITTVLMPTFAGIPKSDRARAIALLNVSAKISLGVTFGAALLLAMFAEPLLALWLGSSVAAHAITPLRIILAGIIFNSPAIVYLSFLLGNGRPDLSAKLDIATLAYYLPLMLALIYNFGLTGAAIAYLIRMVITCLALGMQALWLSEYGNIGYPRCAAFAAFGAGVVLLTVVPMTDIYRTPSVAAAGLMWLFAAWCGLFDASQRALLCQRFRTVVVRVCWIKV